jgi:uncharacterized protein (TIGR02145 family)
MKKKYKIQTHRIVIGIILLLVISCEKNNNDRTVIDIDGNVYRTVIIGTQEWMAENLKVTRYCNGDSIETTIPTTRDISNDAFPAFQWAYNGDNNYVATYGRLYTWYVLTNSCPVCPDGWHLPSDNEWNTLINYLGGENVADKIKETGTAHWVSPNNRSTNETGFTALPSGTRNFHTFDYLGYSCWFWSSTENDSISAWTRCLDNSGNVVQRVQFLKVFGYSVRCLKD